MENHPIPQDITGFKFKLIGSVTVKQFLYLFGAGLLCYFFYSSPIFFLIKFPLILSIGGSGAALAFLPIDGRPLDKMIIYYLKAIPRENLYLFKKKGVDLYVETIEIPEARKKKIQEIKAQKEETQIRKDIILSKLKRSFFSPDEIELNFLNKIKPFLEEAIIKSPMKKEAQTLSKPQVQAQNIDIDTRLKRAQEAEQIQKKVREEEEKKRIEQASAFDMNKKLRELEARLLGDMRQKELPQEKPLDIDRAKTADTISTINKPVEKATPQATQMRPQAHILAGFPVLPDVPNIILGIVKDPRGRVLPNIIVEVIDKSNNPVRAFKTNQLGQFASATPLPNGTYRILFEDPQKQHEFDTIEITLEGNIFSPLEVISTDAREKLRQELFGK